MVQRSERLKIDVPMQVEIQLAIQPKIERGIRLRIQPGERREEQRGVLRETQLRVARGPDHTRSRGVSQVKNRNLPPGHQVTEVRSGRTPARKEEAGGFVPAGFLVRGRSVFDYHDRRSVVGQMRDAEVDFPAPKYLLGPACGRKRSASSWHLCSHFAISTSPLLILASLAVLFRLSGCSTRRYQMTLTPQSVDARPEVKGRRLDCCGQREPQTSWNVPWFRRLLRQVAGGLGNGNDKHAVGLQTIDDSVVVE